MLITAPCVAALTWRLEDTLGNVIDELAEPTEFFVGGHDLLDQVERALAQQAVGFQTTLHLEPEHAFGDYDAALVFFEDRAAFPQGTAVGMQFDALPPGCKTTGMPADTIYTVTEIYPEHVVLDGNHPLAGIALRLALTVQGVRQATPEEIERGSVAGASLAVLGSAPSSPRPH